MWAVASVAMVVALYFYVASFKFTLIDDAYIQLQYARNLAENQTWGFLPGRTANSATSPLNVLLMASVGFVFSFVSMVQLALWLTAVELALTLLILLRISGHLFDGRRFFGLLAFVGIAANPLFLSTFGLEGSLYTLLLVFCLDMLLTRHWAVLAVALALLTLTRPDGVLLFVVMLALAPMTWRQRGWVTLLYGLALLPWHLYSWLQLGSLVPDTLLMKLEQTAWGPTTFADGFDLYMLRYPTETRLSLLLLPFGLLLLLRFPPRAGQLVAISGSYAVLHYLAYTVMAVPPYHWYYISQIVPIVLIGSLGLATAVDLIAERWSDRITASRVAALIALALPVAGLLFVFASHRFPLWEAPIHSNWATPSQYRVIGLDLQEIVEPGEVVEVRGEIGTLTFYSQRYLVDDFGDMNQMAGMIVNNDYDNTPVAGDLVSWNFSNRTLLPPLPPPTYILEFIPADSAAEHPPDVVKVWRIDAKWVEPMYVYLRQSG